MSNNSDNNNNNNIILPIPPLAQSALISIHLPAYVRNNPLSIYKSIQMLGGIESLQSTLNNAEKYTQNQYLTFYSRNPLIDDFAKPLHGAIQNNINNQIAIKVKRKRNCSNI